MGQLTNQFVSQSYQGILNLENANTGVTSTLQYVTDGVGNRIPMQASTSSIVISGSFYGDGSGLTGVTTTLPSGVVSGSQQIVDLGFATTSSLDTLSGSIAVTDLAQNNRLTSLEGITGSLQNQINQKLDTGSFNTYTSSVNTKLAGLDIETGSLQNQIDGLATTGSLSGYTTVTTFNNYTSSNDTKVNDLISKTGSYATTGSNNFVGQQRINGNLIVTGSITSTQEINAGNGVYTSFVQAGVSALNLNANNFIDIKSNTSGVSKKVRIYNNDSSDKNVPVEITGSLTVTGNINATSASFTYVNTVYETASVIYSSGSNQFGDASNDTQTLYGTVVLPNGPLDITGSLRTSGQIRTDDTLVAINGVLTNNISNPATSGDIEINSGLFKVSIVGDTEVTGTLKVTGGITGSLEGTASYATQALSASYAPDTTNTGSLVADVALGLGNNIVNVTKGDGSVTSFTINDVNNATSASYATNALSSSHSDYSEDAGLLNGTGSGVFATTGSNTFLGDQTITGSVNVSGSVNLVGPTSLNALVPNDYKQNLILLSGKNQVTSSTVLNNYLNAITTSLNSSDYNFGMIPAPALIGVGIQNLTGSIFISGSNNFIMNLGSGAPATQGRRGLLGSANFVQTATPTINTSSLTTPIITNNYLASSVQLTYSSGSVLGNSSHQINSNIVLNGVNLNHISSSNAGSNQTVYSNNINVAAITSNASGSLLTTGINIGQNITVGNINLNHISSSINYTNNLVAAGASNTVNNRYFQTGSNNSVAFASNMIGGQGITFNIAGSPATNVNRTIVGNLIGGQGVVVSAEATGIDTGGLRNSLIWGQQLIVSGSHSAAVTTQQSATMIGRWNGQDNGLADTARTVFAVGTGTGTSNRRTGFYITSGSLVGISGSLDVKGNSTFTGSIDHSGSYTTNGVVTTTNKFLAAGSNPLIEISGSNPILRLQENSTDGIYATVAIDDAANSDNNMGYYLSTYTGLWGSNPVATFYGGGTGNNKDGGVDIMSAYNGKLSIYKNTEVTGSLDVTGSVTIANGGDLTMYGHKMFNGAQYMSSETQSGSAAVSQSITFQQTGPEFGVSLVSGSRITVANAGTYNIQFSAQLLADTGADDIFMWFTKNGNNITYSTTRLELENNQESVMTVNVLDTAAANDYYEIKWETTNGDAVLLFQNGSSNYPAIPSVIGTITQVR